MSVKIMAKVWESAKQDGSSLLLLLALADHASDDGVCWPGIERLAEKTRKGKRQTQRLLTGLEESGELFINRTVGRGNTNLYLITIGLTIEEIVHTLVKRFELEPDIATQTAKEIIQKRDTDVTFSSVPESEKGDIQGEKGDILDEKVTSRARKGDIAMSPEPSINHQINRQEPSDIPPDGGLPAAETFDSPISETPNPARQQIEDLRTRLGDDPLTVGLNCARLQAEQGNWVTPPDAGGDDNLGQAMFHAWCETKHLDPGTVPAGEARRWRDALRRVAELHSADLATACQAVRLVLDPESPRFGWYGGYANPHVKKFSNDLGAVIMELKSGHNLEAIKRMNQGRGGDGERQQPSNGPRDPADYYRGKYGYLIANQPGDAQPEPSVVGEPTR